MGLLIAYDQIQISSTYYLALQMPFRRSVKNFRQPGKQRAKFPMRNSLYRGLQSAFNLG